MSRLPRFTASQQVEETGVTPATGFGKGLTDLANSVQQIGEKQFLTAQVSKAEKQGTLAGSDLGFKPGAGNTIAQEAFNKTGLETNKQLLTTDIQLKLPQLQQNAISDNPTNTEMAAKQFQKTSEQYSTNLLSNTPEELRPLVQNYLRFHTEGVNSKFSEQLMNEQKAKVQAQSVIVNSAHQDGVNRALLNLNFNAPKDIVKAQLGAVTKLQVDNEKNIAKQGELGLFGKNSGKVAGNLILKSRKEYQSQIILQHYKDKVTEGKGEAFIQNVKKRTIPGFNEFEKEALLKKIQKMENLNSNMGAADKSELRTKRNNYIKGISLGGERQFGFEQQFESTFPTQVNKFQADIKNSEFLKGQKSLIEGSTPAQQKDMLAIANPDSENPFIRAQQEANLKAQESFVASDKKAFESDRNSYMLSRPDVQKQLLNRYTQDQSGFSYTDLPNSGLNPIPADPIGRNILAQEQKGARPDQTQALTTGAAKKAVRSLITAPTLQDKQNILQSLQRQYDKPGQPNYMPIVMRNLVENQLPLNSTFLLGGEVNPVHDQSLTLAASENLKEIQKNMTPDQIKSINTAMLTERSTGSSALNQYMSTMNVFGSPGLDDHKTALSNFVRTYASALMKTENMGASEAIKTAVGFITDKYNYGFSNGAPLRIPKTIKDPTKSIPGQVIHLDPQDVEGYANYALENIVPKLDFFPKGTPQMEKDAEMQRIRNGHFATEADNTGMILLDSNGNQTLQVNGKPVILKFKDIPGWWMSHPEISKSISLTQSERRQRPLEIENDLTLLGP